MEEKTYIRLAVGIGLFVLTSAATAQQEQWLQYHSAREASQIVGDMSLQVLKLRTTKPKGLRAPELKGQDQLFAKWSTPTVEKGQLWIALDRTHKNGLYDLLCIDSNGNNRLKDETAVKAYRTDERSAYFGPVKVVFQTEDGPVTYHLNFRFYSYNDSNRRLYASSGGWYEGTVRVGGAKKHCVLIDYNANGVFDDKSISAGSCDRIRIGAKGDRDTRFVGNYIDVDGVLYRPEIARDGAFIKLGKAEDVKFGSIRLPESITEFSAGGENGLLTFKPEEGFGSLPVGQYRVNFWTVERKDEKGSRWELQGRSFSDKGLFDIAGDKEAELSIGEPIISTVEAQNRSGTYYFSQDLKGRLGERIELTRGSARPRAPRLHIKSKDGTYDRTFSFEYG